MLQVCFSNFRAKTVDGVQAFYHAPSGRRASYDSKKQDISADSEVALHEIHESKCNTIVIDLIKVSESSRNAVLRSKVVALWCDPQRVGNCTVGKSIPKEIGCEVKS